MNIYVSVDNVEIKEHNKLHEGEYKINKCFFEFSEEYTQNLTSRAVFTTINGTYEETIINNQCDIPTEVLKEKGDVEIGVYSYEIDNEELKLRYSPGSTKFSVDNGSYKEANQTEAPTPSEFEKYLYSFNENAVNKTNEFNENANRKITELNKISTDVSNMKNSVETSEQNTKTSENNAKISETSAQNSANKASQSETNIVNIEKNINAIKEQIDTINTNIDGQVNTVNTLAKNASDQATKAENQAKISKENAAATSADKTAVSEMKSEVEGLKNEAKTSRDEAESFKYETLEAKEVVKNSLENERIESEKRYAKAVDTEVITVEEFAQVELDEDGYMEDVVVEASKEITQEVREGYNDLKYPYVNTTKTKKGITFTDNGNGSITINGTATENVEFSCQWKNKVPNGSYSYITYGLPSNCYCNYYYVGNKYGEAVGNYNTDETEGNITLGMSIHIPSGVTVNNVTVYPMLVKGQYTKETIPAWEQYGVSPSLNYPSEFENMVKEVDIQNNSITNKIALSEGQFLGNFKGYSNAIDKGVLKGQLKEVVLTGNESIYNSSNGNIFRISLDTPHLENTSTQVKTDLVKSNYFNNVSYAELNDASVDNGIEIYNNYIQFRDSQIASVEEWKAKLKELYDAGTPVKILYVAQTEEQQELSQENLQVINSLQIYQGENNVSTPKAKLSFKANQGLSSYVDKVVDDKLVENNISEREISDSKYPRALKPKVSETDFTQVFAENEKIEGLQIYGAELTQETREGYNKLDINSLSTLTKNGVTWTINGDGSISVSGTCVNYESNVTLKAGKLDVGEYTYKCFGLPSTCKTNIWSVGDVTGEGIRKFTAKEGVDHNIVVVVPIGETVNFTIKPMLVKGSYTNETLPPYEQYGAMPSLDFPSEVQVVNKQEIQNEKKNILHTKRNFVGEKTNNGLKYKIQSDGSFLINGTSTGSYSDTYSTTSFMSKIEMFKLRAGRKYRMYLNIRNSKLDTGRIRFFMGPYSNNGYFVDVFANEKSAYKDIDNLTKDVSITHFGISGANGLNTTRNNLEVEIYIYDITNGIPKDESYEMYEVIETQISLPQDTFTGAIGSYKDTIKEVDGRYKVANRIEELILTGDENIALDDVYNGISQFSLNINKSVIYDNLKAYVYSNYFKGIGYGNSWLYDNTITMKLSTSSICMMTSKYTTVDDFKAKLKELYGAGTPVKVYYILAAPDYIDLPDETQEILNGIELRLGLNNFSIDVGTFEFIYNKSLEKAFEEKDALIEELASRVLALENATLNLTGGQ